MLPSAADGRQPLRHRRWRGWRGGAGDEHAPSRQHEWRWRGGRELSVRVAPALPALPVQPRPVLQQHRVSATQGEAALDQFPVFVRDGSTAADVVGVSVRRRRQRDGLGVRQAGDGTDVIKLPQRLHAELRIVAETLITRRSSQTWPELPVTTSGWRIFGNVKPMKLLLRHIPRCVIPACVGRC